MKKRSTEKVADNNEFLCKLQAQHERRKSDMKLAKDYRNFQQREYLTDRVSAIEGFVKRNQDSVKRLPAYVATSETREKLIKVCRNIMV